MSTLSIVATPIGNLSDITFRSIEVLKSVDIILAEDTRTSLKLLKHYKISAKVDSFHMYNEHKKLNSIIKKIKGGTSMALISDSGTPGISDPGFLLVRECIKNGINVECLPGPTALIPALILSGMPSEKFAFEGFLPVKKGRTKRLNELSNENRTLIFYESPHRINKTLNDLGLIFGDTKKISISREISKKYENTFRGTISESIDFYNNNKPKGEFVIVLSPN